MSASKPIVFVSRGAPPKGLEILEQTCELRRWEGQGFIPRAEMIERVRGVHALFVHPPDPVDAEVLDAAEMIERVRGVHVLFVRSPDPVDAEVLDAAGPQLKVVGTMSVGLDHVDLTECKKRGVLVGYTPGVLTTAVAELAVALLLTTARRLQEGMRAVHSGVWGTRWDNALWMTGKEVAGSTMGIVGLGRIGLAVAKRLKAFEPSRILYCGHSPKPYADEVGAEFTSFDQLLSTSDIVLAMCSVSANNRNLFDSSAFSKMKSSAIFINVTRGALVDQEALLAALTSGQIAAAGLDVTSPEPLSPEHALLKLPNCTVVPHLGSATDETRNAMCKVTVDNILAGLNGKPLPFPAY